MQSSPNVISLPQLVRIRATGADRAKFLHNFCTNNINDLSAGNWCEAFFVNVKARILAHGFVLAAEDHHEVWLLPGDEEQLLNHLNRYVITEDVEFESLTAECGAIAVLGTIPDSLAVAVQPQIGHWADLANADVRSLSCQWDGRLVSLMSGPPRSVDSLHSAIIKFANPGKLSDFERLRIQERFPLIGHDLSDDHLAPEAARDASAICYTKGCYLGQEPIARIDARGQVNRIFAAVELETESPDSETAIQLTSFDAAHSPAVGLAVLRADSVRSGSAIVRTPAGQVFSATILQPKSND